MSMDTVGTRIPERAKSREQRAECELLALAPCPLLSALTRHGFATAAAPARSRRLLRRRRRRRRRHGRRAAGFAAAGAGAAGFAVAGARLASAAAGILAGVESLDHFAGDVERGIDVDGAGIARAEEQADRQLLDHRVDDRPQLLLELGLERLLQLLHFGVRVFLKAIDFDGEAIDFLLRLRARRLVQYRAALLQLLLVALQRLGFVLELGGLLLRQRLHLAARDLALGRLGGDALQIEERHSQWRLRAVGTAASPGEAAPAQRPVAPNTITLNTAATENLVI